MLNRLFSRFSRNAVRSAAKQAEIDAHPRKLALYNLTLCPYCIRVRLTIRRLGLNIEIRNAGASQWGNQLVREGGRFQAPCLRIEDPEQGTRWLYESDAIILYLQQHFPPE